MKTDKSIWTARFSAANRRYDEWAGRYSCDLMEKYYRGEQWANTNGMHKPYTLNLISSTIKLKIANYLVHTPKAMVIPLPGDAAFNLEKAVLSAQLKEGFINTIIANDFSTFGSIVKRAVRDSFLRFGMLEVGFSANYIENPELARPEYKSNRVADTTKDKVITIPDEVLESERIYFKYISPKRFRVGSVEEPELKKCNWVGYYEYVYIKDLLKALGRNLDDMSLLTSSDNTTKDSELTLEDQTKIWHIWDNRSHERKIVIDSTGEEAFNKPFDRLPLFDLRWDIDFEGFYPIPPVTSWLSPQDEINESREQARNHRRIFTRKFQARKNSVTPEEVDKFEGGPDGTIIFTEMDSAIQPIQNADLGKASDQALVVSKDDFNLVSATSQEARGLGDRVTATQANIIESRANVREGSEVEEINAWMAKMLREAILVAGDRLTAPVTIEMPKNQQSDFLFGVSGEKSYSTVYPEQLKDGFDFRVIIDAASTSPNQNELEKQRFLEFLAVMERFPQLSLSPTLIREAAYRIGYRNERVIREMQNAALLQMIGQAAGAGGNLAESNNGTAQQIVEAQTPPTSAGIENQLDNQLVQ